MARSEQQASRCFHQSQQLPELVSLGSAPHKTYDVRARSPLEITTQEGVSFTTTEDVIELSGNASPGVFAIEVEGHPEVTFEREGRSG